MTTNLAKWASNNGQIIKSGLPNDRRAKFLPSVVGFAYDLLRYECYLGNIGLEELVTKEGASEGFQYLMVSGMGSLTAEHLSTATPSIRWIPSI